MSVIQNHSEDLSLLKREDNNGIARLTLNRPQARNALSMEMMAALQSELDAIALDTAVKCVVICGSGPVFCAGHDLKQMRSHGQDLAYYETVFATCSKLMMSIVQLPKIVIAQVHGLATAAGLQLMSSCDLVVATDDARFATPGVNLGAFCSTPMVAISRVLPRKRMMEMLALGEAISAQTALDWGLINRVVPADQLNSTVEKMTQSIASKPSHSIEVGKEAFYRQMEMTLEQAYDYTYQIMAKGMITADAGEGIDAFIEKRKPVWRSE